MTIDEESSELDQRKLARSFATYFVGYGNADKARCRGCIAANNARGAI
jgi:hypothetical protein